MSQSKRTCSHCDNTERWHISAYKYIEETIGRQAADDFDTLHAVSDPDNDDD